MTEGQTSAFWRFSLALYRRKGVAPACLILQDSSGVDVNVMLYGLWLASLGRRLSADDMRGIDARVRSWRQDVVVPLRGVRRVLKQQAAPFDTPAVQQLRDRVKAMELESERLQQEALFLMQPPGEWGAAEPDVQVAAAANLAAYEAALGARFDEGAQSAMLAGMRALAIAGVEEN